jgi:pentatricopeptide repeat protein
VSDRTPVHELHRARPSTALEKGETERGSSVVSVRPEGEVRDADAHLSDADVRAVDLLYDLLTLPIRPGTGVAQVSALPSPGEGGPGVSLLVPGETEDDAASWHPSAIAFLTAFQGSNVGLPSPAGLVPEDSATLSFGDLTQQGQARVEQAIAAFPTLVLPPVREGDDAQAESTLDVAVRTVASPPARLLLLSWYLAQLGYQGKSLSSTDHVDRTARLATEMVELLAAGRRGEWSTGEADEDAAAGALATSHDLDLTWTSFILPVHDVLLRAVESTAIFQQDTQLARSLMAMADDVLSSNLDIVRRHDEVEARIRTDAAAITVAAADGDMNAALVAGGLVTHTTDTLADPTTSLASLAPLVAEPRIAVSLLRAAARTYTPLPAADAIFHAHRRNGGAADRPLFHAMLNVCTVQGAVERALGLYDEMFFAGPDGVPVGTTYDLLLACLAKRRDYADQAPLLFERMVSAGHVPTARTYASLMSAAAIRGDVDGAAGILEEAEEAFQAGDAAAEPTSVHYCILLKALAQAQLQRRPKGRDGRDADEDKAPTLMSSQEARLVLAERVFTKFMQSPVGLRASKKDRTYVTNALLTVYARALRLNRATHVFQTRFAELGLDPDTTSYNILISMFAKARRPLRAMEVFEAMGSTQVRPDAYSYRAVLRALAIGPMLKSGIEVLRQARAAGVNLRLSDAARFYEEARKLDQGTPILELVRVSDECFVCGRSGHTADEHRRKVALEQQARRGGPGRRHRRTVG